MELPKREIKNIYHGDAARAKLVAGAQKMADIVGSTYGPRGYNVILGMPFGDPTLTRDGVTVAKRVILKDKAEDEAAQILRQASERTNKSAGDGTTATIVFANNLFQAGNKLIAAGENGMVLKRVIEADSKKVIAWLNEKSIKAGQSHLINVATISAGDAAIGALISDTLKDIGESGGISIREHNYPTLDVERVDGYLFDRGFYALTQMVEYSLPFIFVTNKTISSNADMVPLLDFILHQANKNLVIAGEVRANSEASNTLILNVLQGKLNAVVIPPPAYQEEGTSFMQDIALYCGAKLFLDGDDMKQIDDKTFGTAERTQVSDRRAIIFRGSGAPEDIEKRAKDLKDQIASERDSHAKDNLEQRLAKLTGKIAIVNVGGATPTGMEELRYRVEDAIEATKSAMADGVLPGGGTTLVCASYLPELSKLYRDALQDTFRHLMNNAAEPADYRLEQIARSEFGYGFNLRSMSDEPVNLAKAGIFDATRAVVQTVENATEAAMNLLTAGSIVDPVEDKRDVETTNP
jgi:chaperonin GroEL